MSTHTAVALTTKGQVSEIQTPTKRPENGHIRIKVHYAALNPPDLYQVDRAFFVQSYPTILGFTAAGVVDEIGADIDDLKVGDRVTSFVFLDMTNRATQEYIVQPRTVVAKIPDNLSLEEAATIPDNFVCAFYVLFHELGLPIPSSFPPSETPALTDTPILVYGASATTGLFTVQLLQAAGYKKIIATASPRNHEQLQSLGAAATFDYRSPSLAEDIAAFVGGDGKVLLAMDCISTTSTGELLGNIIAPDGKVAVLVPIKDGSSIAGDEEGQQYFVYPEGRNPFASTTEVVYVATFSYQKDEYLKNNLVPKILPKLLESGLIKPTRLRLLDEGSFKARVEAGLDLIRQNKVSGEKVIVKVAA